MKRKALYIMRQCLVGLIALQFLNLSVCSDAYWDSGYDYMYAYNKTYDPTETAVELIVEMKYGQQPAFTYDQRTDANRSIAKNFHWHTDLHCISLPISGGRPSKQRRPDEPAKKIPSSSADPGSPPPEPLLS